MASDFYYIVFFSPEREYRRVSELLGIRKKCVAVVLPFTGVAVAAEYTYCCTVPLLLLLVRVGGSGCVCVSG